MAGGTASSQQVSVEEATWEITLNSTVIAGGSTLTANPEPMVRRTGASGPNSQAIYLSHLFLTKSIAGQNAITTQYLQTACHF